MKVSWAESGKDEGYTIKHASLELPLRTESPSTVEDVDPALSVENSLSGLKGALDFRTGAGGRQVILADGSTVVFTNNRISTTYDGDFRDYFVVTPDGKASAIDYRQARFTKRTKVVSRPDPDDYAPPSGDVTKPEAYYGKKYSRVPARITEDGYLEAKFDGTYQVFRPLVPLDKLKPPQE